MYEQLLIVVPSAGRAGRVRCLDQLPPALLERTVLAVPAEEAVEYADKGDKSCHIIGVPANVRGIAPTRQYMTDWAYAYGARFLLQISDDVQFFRRKSCSDVKLRKAEEDDVTEMVDVLMELCEQHGHAGVSARAGNNRQEDPIRLATRMCDVYMHDITLLRDLGVRWDRNVVMEDFDVTLSLLRRGYPNAVVYEWAWDQPGSNAAGGCSTYRTYEVQKQGAQTLAELHPDFVKVVQKPSKNWKGFTDRWDVNVQWLKAFRTADLAATVDA